MGHILNSEMIEEHHLCYMYSDYLPRVIIIPNPGRSDPAGHFPGADLSYRYRMVYMSRS